MLHKINLACETEFNWIITLQRDLLEGVCRPDINAESVTTGWVKALRPDIDAGWMAKFCNRKDKLSKVKRSLIQHLKTIANCDDTVKSRIIANFNHNNGFKNAFDPDQDQPHPVKPIEGITDIDNVIKALRGFFISFYDPNLYSPYGFPIPNGNNPINFTNKCFLEDFFAKNLDIGVCVLCDGDLGDPDIDHFMPIRMLHTDLSPASISRMFPLPIV